MNLLSILIKNDCGKTSDRGRDCWEHIGVHLQEGHVGILRSELANHARHYGTWPTPISIKINDHIALLDEIIEFSDRIVCFGYHALQVYHIICLSQIGGSRRFLLDAGSEAYAAQKKKRESTDIIHRMVPFSLNDQDILFRVKIGLFLSKAPMVVEIRILGENCPILLRNYIK